MHISQPPDPRPPDGADNGVTSDHDRAQPPGTDCFRLGHHGPFCDRYVASYAPAGTRSRPWLGGVAGCLDGRMRTRRPPRVVSASCEIAAGAGRIFELIADPAQQPRWDGNDNLGTAPAGQRIRHAGDVFTMTLSRGAIRENHVVEYEEGRRLAWMPAEVGRKPPGHLWRWELEPIDSSRTLVTHTYDWTQLNDKKRLKRARSTTADRLRASLDRLAALAEQS
jgi:uncharacterized protein YndB with AHSA1/START domain